MDPRILETALRYCQKFQFSIIPVDGRNKKPLIKWDHFQKEKATPEQIRKWFERWPSAGIGIVTGSLSRLAVIDVDDPINGMAKVSEYLTNSKVPTVRTPRGGFHLYFRPPEKCPGNAAGCPRGVDFRGEGGYIIAPPSQNGAGRDYQWHPGLSLDDIEPPPLPGAYIKNLNSFKQGFYIGGCGGNEVGKDAPDLQRPPMTSTDLQEGGRDEALFHVANALVKGGMPQNEVEQVLVMFAEKCCNPPFPAREVFEKVKSAIKRAERRERNIAAEVRDYLVTSNGWFLTSDVHQRLVLTSREEKKAANWELLKNLKDGVIERDGTQNGRYRKVEADFEEIKIDDAEDKPFNIEMGLGLDEKVVLYEKNIAVVSGSYDSGKTAYLLNLAFNNRTNQRVRYLSSEMGKPELKSRLRAFGHGLTEWQKIKFVDRSSNFVDVIDPTGLNIIDFLELTQDVYLVAEHLKKIYQKLTTGVCFVAIQKKKDADLGRGAEFSAEKPRLYLSFDPGKIKIIKAKNWRDSTVNPRGMELRFKLVAGCKFHIEEDWKRPGEETTPSLYRETETQAKYRKKHLGKNDLTKEFQGMF